jgi:hypothetical protein
LKPEENQAIGRISREVNKVKSKTVNKDCLLCNSILE